MSSQGPLGHQSSKRKLRCVCVASEMISDEVSFFSKVQVRSMDECPSRREFRPPQGCLRVSEAKLKRSCTDVTTSPYIQATNASFMSFDNDTITYPQIPSLHDHRSFIRFLRQVSAAHDAQMPTKLSEISAPLTNPNIPNFHVTLIQTAISKKDVMSDQSQYKHIFSMETFAGEEKLQQTARVATVRLVQAQNAMI